MESVHGGDIYRNLIEHDFSVNINPLGMPEELKTALHQAVNFCDTYPDIFAGSLKRVVSEIWKIPQEYLLFGNGASELFMAVVHAVKPKKTVIPVPSFYGYEYAAQSEEGEIVYYEGSVLDLRFFKTVRDDTDLIFLANPNNPTGTLINKNNMAVFFRNCRDREITVVLDECFIDFCGKDVTMLSEIGQFQNLILVRAFTKIFSIPGVRLGFLVCSDEKLRAKIKRQLPEWNLSCFAQAAGCGCAGQTEYLKKTVSYVTKERKFLENGLKRLKIQIFPGGANFLLVYTEKPLYDELLKKHILIRDCSNFRGLSKGYYRIAVKNRAENEILLKAIGEINWNER